MAAGASHVNGDSARPKSTRRRGKPSPKSGKRKSLGSLTSAPVRPFDEDSTIEIIRQAADSSASPAPTHSPVSSATNKSKPPFSPCCQPENVQQESCMSVLESIAHSPTRSTTTHQNSRRNSPANPADKSQREESVPAPEHAANHISTNGKQKELIHPSNRHRGGNLRARMSDSSPEAPVSSNQGSPPLISALCQPFATPADPAQRTYPDSTRKRPNDANYSHERRVRPRTNANYPVSAGQLPTPHDSPTVPYNSPTLSEQLESQLVGRILPSGPHQAEGSDYTRFDMLRDACRLNDHFFLLTHFIFSNCSPSNRNILAPFSLTETHFRGLDALSAVLCGESPMRSTPFDLYAEFPYPAETMINNTISESNALLEDVRSSLDVLAAGLSELKESVMRRGFPPAPVELKVQLKVPSPVMQKALFYHLYPRPVHHLQEFNQAFWFFQQELVDLIEEFTTQSIAQPDEIHPTVFKLLVNRWSRTYSRVKSGYWNANFAPWQIQAAGGPDSHRSIPRIRSPEYRQMDESNGNAFKGPYYQFTEDLIVLSEPICADSPLMHWNVHISRDQWARRATTLPVIGQFGRREPDVSNGNVQFRLKSIVVDAGGEEKVKPTPSDFYVQPTKWPMCLSVAINGDYDVDCRSEVQYGVDLAADVTNLLREGDNEVLIGAYFSPQEQRSHCNYLMAVEITCVASYDKIKSMPTRISAADVVGAITDSLKSVGDGTEDGDLAICQPVMSIDLTDPFTSVIWGTPVRGKECRHRECFDLEKFLASQADRVNEGGVTSPDRWQCPICEGDARPNVLVIDEFLLGVRKTLEKANQLQTRTILVKEDGTWEPKTGLSISEDQHRDMPGPEPSTRLQQPAPQAVPQAPAASKPVSAPSTPQGTRTIIVIEDD